MWEFFARSLNASTIFTIAALGELIGQEFERDIAPQVSVFGLVHHTHAPAA